MVVRGEDNWVEEDSGYCHPGAIIGGSMAVTLEAAQREPHQGRAWAGRAARLPDNGQLASRWYERHAGTGRIRADACAAAAGAGGAHPVRALVIQHEAVTPGGPILDWLSGHGAEAEAARIDAEHGDIDVGGYDILVSLGSELAPYHDHIPWIQRAAQLLREAHEWGTAVLGICFGAQLLACALGARCCQADAAEIGWLPVRHRDEGLVSAGPWLQWHFDTFEPPSAARVTAESDIGPQTYVIGQSMGVQLHPEVTPQIMRRWVRVYQHELDAEGLDPDALLEKTHESAAAAAARASELSDAFLAQVAKLRGGR
jgi:GMP synthase-like glutamine amidotransferase